MPYCAGRLWLGRSKAKRCMITYVPFCRIDILPYSSLPVWLSSVCRHTFIWRSYFIIFRPKPPHHNNVCKDTSISPTIANDFCAICVRMSGYALLPNWRWWICEKMWKIRSSISKSIHIWDLGLSPLERAHFIYPESGAPEAVLDWGGKDLMGLTICLWRGSRPTSLILRKSGADLAFFQGGVWANDDAEHRPRAAKRRADFFAILNPRKWCFPGIY